MRGTRERELAERELSYELLELVRTGKTLKVRVRVCFGIFLLLAGRVTVETLLLY